MTRRAIAAAALIVGVSFPLAAQSSAAACAQREDSTARQIVKTFGALRVCALAFPGDGQIESTPRTWSKSADRLVLETQREGDNRRLSTTNTRFDWTVNGSPKPYDAAALNWQGAVIDLLADATEADELRAKADKLRSMIDSLPQLRARLSSSIAVVERQASDIRKAISLAQGQDRALQAQITSVNRQIQQLRNQISTEDRNAVNPSDQTAVQRREARLRQLDSEVRRADEQLRGLERREQELDAERRIALMEAQLSDLRPEHTVTKLRIELGNLEGLSVEQLQKELKELDADNRLPALDAQTEKALARLRTLLET